MKKIASYILIMCLVGVSAYAGISAIQEADTFAENALKLVLFLWHSNTRQRARGKQVGEKCKVRIRMITRKDGLVLRLN